jgi:glycosyltransferase involved in cell wall biosynthesis
MRLLITTQCIDRDDPILGFFHGWVEALAERFEHVHVICLKQGATVLPGNVTVYSLGKESGENRIKYVFRFFSYVRGIRGMYDVVFSHMNPHYIVMAGWYWKMKQTPIFFWRNHAKMNLMTKVAASYAMNVFYTSPFACTRVFEHAVQMPVGIDTDTFRRQPIARDENAVLFLGRLSSVKRPELFVETSAHLPEYSFAIYGDEPRGIHAYTEKLKMSAKENLTFYPAVKNYETPQIYNAYGVYVNLTPEGSMDKTILEAMACETLVLVSNKSFQGIIPEKCVLQDSTVACIAAQLKTLLLLTPQEKEHIRTQLRAVAETHHSRTKLVDIFYTYAHNAVTHI